MNKDVAAPLAISELRIAWVLDHPGMSSWLKVALRGALEQNPIIVRNDVELLSNLLRARADAWVQAEFETIIVNVAAT